MSYSGPYDPNESTLVSKDLVTLIEIKASNVAVKGLTITGTFQYKKNIGAIRILETNEQTVIQNCLFRNMAGTIGSEVIESRGKNLLVIGC